MIYEIIQQNFVGTAIILFLVLFILTNNNFDRKTNHLFMASALCVLLLIVEEAWEWQLAQMPIYRSPRTLLSAVGYTLRPMTAYFLVMIIRRSTLWWNVLMSVPIAVNALVAFSALFGKWAFWYTEANEFVRGPLGYTPFITAGFYIFTLLVMSMWECKKGGMIEAMTVSAIVMLTLTATAMESVFGFRFIQSAGSGISIAFYYLFRHTIQNNRDPLTGALTRRRFYLDAEKYRTALSAVISLDLNNLKMLNDQYGHMEGDKALVTMTRVINRCMKKNAVLYRTGGDEFMILCYKINEKRVQELIGQIQSAMEKTPYRCAAGYALYHYQAGLEEVCHIADSAMYENKKQMKQKALQ